MFGTQQAYVFQLDGLSPEIQNIMNSKSHLKITSFIIFGIATISSSSFLTAADDDLRIVPQLVVGTAGIEPGVALEYRTGNLERIVLRPEVFLSEDSRIGGGAAVLYEVAKSFDLPQAHALAIGPRFVAHNSDDTGWELDAMATYGVALGSMTMPSRHVLGVLAAVGVRNDKEHDETRIGANAGIFYSFRF